MHTTIQWITTRLHRPHGGRAASIAHMFGSRASAAPPELFRDFLALMAEAQSALRHAVWTLVDPDLVDEEQETAFRWVRRMADSHRVFIARYMRINDPADFRRFDALEQQLEDLHVQIRETDKRQRERRDLVGRIRYHARRLADSPRCTSEEHANDYQRITESLEEWVASGFPLTAADLGEVIAPLPAAAREQLSSGSAVVARVVHEVPRAEAGLTGRTTADANVAGGSGMNGRDEEDQADQSDDADDGIGVGVHVRQVRDALNGRRAVVFGGELRRPHLERIEQAFGLRELLWIPMSNVSSAAPLQHALGGDDIAVAFVLIKLSSHYVTEQVPKYCEERAIPVVRLRAGYHPNRIAHDILEQASGRLGICGSGSNGE